MNRIKTSTEGFSLVELLICLVIIGIIFAAIISYFKIHMESEKTTATMYENQSNAKITLNLVSNELKNSRDLCRSSYWEIDKEVFCNYISFQQYKEDTTDVFNSNFSTITYYTKGDSLYRHKICPEGISSEKKLISNLVEGSTVFHLLLGDPASALGRKIDITLTMKGFANRSSKTFESTVFLQNPPKGEYIYDVPVTFTRYLWQP